MRVNKQGEVRHGFEGDWRCNKCGCEWTMDASDPKPAETHDQRDGSAFHMPCPTCKGMVYRAVPRSSSYDR